MLSLKFILDELEAVKENTKQRKMSADFDSLVFLDSKRRELIQSSEEMQQRQNEIARLMKEKLSNEERTPLIQEGRELKDQVQVAQQALEEVKQQLHDIQVNIPNVTHPDVPMGDSDAEHAVLRKWGKPTSFSFEPKDHVDLGNDLDLIDWEAGAKVAGSKFYFLKNEAVLLDLALQQYALRLLETEDFTLIATPDMARKQILEGIGFNPRGDASQIYSIENTDLSLIATAEITLGGMLADEVLEETNLPLQFAGLSHCFRTEAGAAGRVSRGLYRVHQFTKVEMFAFSTPEQSEAILEKFCNIEERLFQGLKLPYQVVDCCRGDLGAQAYRKYDIEAWMPGRGEGGSYGEVTSASNCTDYQARRLNIRYRSPDNKKNQFVHTLNGTAIAVSRALLAILENYQQEDGSIVVPEVLRSVVGKDVIRKRVSASS